ncbi:Scr1 family TA system antitoxin-like transcriptional regulator [Streptomyces sp. SID3343]|uniref:Scr1 family TA system antitoxin-like transcriptional regulator n=1 Tax=Streptomyces sp. SID3343 TaxID=2690260 RepID=UPI00136A076D|nr:Scr1 family TA system antitoxin-like transcriptional regulator [Streptomyces sp. SID3343]MYV97650.1 hypothetical protein [Streptomyces sp. SID3343]
MSSGRPRPTALDDAPDTVLVTFLDPRVLHHTIGDAAVMADQIRALRRATQRPHTHIRTVSAATTTPAPSIAYLRFADGRELICLEQADAVVYLRESDHHRAALDRIALVAHDHAETRRQLTRAEHAHRLCATERGPAALPASFANDPGPVPTPTSPPRPDRENPA